MGWSTELFCNISFNKKTYNSLYDVERDIEECKDLMKVCVDKLRALALMTEPQKMLNCADCEGNAIEFQIGRPLPEKRNEVLLEVIDAFIHFVKLHYKMIIAVAESKLRYDLEEQSYE